MKSNEVSTFVCRYLEATNCKVIEKAPEYVTVQLSPEADRALTGRSYYWDFVERTGVPPETMSFTFVFNEEPEKQQLPKKTDPAAERRASDTHADTILGRYLGVVPTYTAPGSGPRKELLTYGSRRLDQIFAVVQEQGKYVMLYEDVPPQTNGFQHSKAYTSWLGVNYKVEFACDMKREELHSLGISLSTGEIVTQFHEQIIRMPLTPKLPPGAFIRRTISLNRAISDLEQYLEQHIRTYDDDWALHAQERLSEELVRVDAYYSDTLRETTDEQEKLEIAEQYRNRKQEIEWQYAPRIVVSVINCGLFHLFSDTFSRIDGSR